MRKVRSEGTGNRRSEGKSGVGEVREMRGNEGRESRKN